MIIQYKCTCMPTEVDLRVPERKTGEDIKSFMDNMSVAISKDHSTRSPLCTRTTMEYAKVPMDDNKPIGETPLRQKQ